MNIDRYEVVKCVEEIIGKNNLVSNPEISERNIIVKVKDSSNINIIEYEKKIADCIGHFVSSPFGVVIT
jgi:hypothetical protein